MINLKNIWNQFKKQSVISRKEPKNFIFWSSYFNDRKESVYGKSSLMYKKRDIHKNALIRLSFQLNCIVLLSSQQNQRQCVWQCKSECETNVEFPTKVFIYSYAKGLQHKPLQESAADIVFRVVNCRHCFIWYKISKVHKWIVVVNWFSSKWFEQSVFNVVGNKCASLY